MNFKTKNWLTRKEAAAHLVSIGYPVTPRTLANLASRQKGPPYRRLMHKLTVYQKDKLETWAALNTVDRTPESEPRKLRPRNLFPERR